MRSLLKLVHSLRIHTRHLTVCFFLSIFPRTVCDLQNAQTALERYYQNQEKAGGAAWMRPDFIQAQVVGDRNRKLAALIVLFFLSMFFLLMFFFLSKGGGNMSLPQYLPKKLNMT